jgi:catechol 2,3-dioxygenase-like lactoylglutathione lyase family enzyme
MEHHRGRLLDHVHLRVADLDASRRFYGAVLGALVPSIEILDGPGFFTADELFVSSGDGPLSRVHLAFQANDRGTVQRFYEAALAAGGTDNGSPGERSYHAGYYAAYVLDPDRQQRGGGVSRAGQALRGSGGHHAGDAVKRRYP